MSEITIGGEVGTVLHVERTEAREWHSSGFVQCVWMLGRMVSSQYSGPGNLLSNKYIIMLVGNYTPCDESVAVQEPCSLGQRCYIGNLQNIT